jgi:hypothetical protein
MTNSDRRAAGLMTSLMTFVFGGILGILAIDSATARMWFFIYLGIQAVLSVYTIGIYILAKDWRRWYPPAIFAIFFPVPYGLIWLFLHIQAEYRKG